MGEFHEGNPELVLDYKTFYNVLRNYLQLLRGTGSVGRKTGSAYFNVQLKISKPFGMLLIKIQNHKFQECTNWLCIVAQVKLF